MFSEVDKTIEEEDPEPWEAAEDLKACDADEVGLTASSEDNISSDQDHVDSENTSESNL